MTRRSRRGAARKYHLIIILSLTFFIGVQALWLANSNSVHALSTTELLPDILAPSTPTGGAPSDTHKTTNDFYFTWNTSTDDRQGDVHYELRLSRDESKVGNAPDSSGAWMSDLLSEPSLHSTGREDGVWYWQVRAIDLAGNKSPWSEVWKVAIDTTKPTLDVSEPLNQQIFNESDRKTINVSAFLQDEQGLARFHIDMDGNDSAAQTREVDNTDFSGHASLTVITVFTATDFSDGVHTINMSVTDKAGNVTVESRRIIIDSTSPMISTNITNDQVFTGMVPVALYADEANPQVYSISITDEKGNTVAGSYDPNSDSGTFIYNWDSTTSPNGIYSIKYIARDAAGHESVLYRTVKVNNKPIVHQQPPNIAIEPGVDGRTIYGTVSDAGATFTVSIDGIVRSDAAIHIGEQIEGEYVWYMELPADIASGRTHSLEVIAHANGLDSETAQSMFTISSGEGMLTPDGSDSLLDQLSASLTQLFNIPSDIINPATPMPVTAQIATDNETILGAKTAKDSDGNDTKNVPVTATYGGWKLFGLYWYWWLLFGGIGGGGVAWLTARMRLRANAMDV